MSQTSPLPAESHSPALYLRLTALWALCEAGLGGLLHLFKLPLTGILVSGFAIMCIALLGYYSRFRASVIVQAWAVVMAIKFTFSPHSPPTAYLAVTFQAFFSLLCFKIIPNFRLACVVAGMVALVESAGQRILVLTIGFGMDFWRAIDQIQLTKKGDPLMLSMMSHSQLLIFGYLLLHAGAGAWVGWLTGRLPGRIENERRWLRSLEPSTLEALEKDAVNTRKKRRRPLVVPALLLLAGLVLLLLERPLGWSLLRAALLWLLYTSAFVQRHLFTWMQHLIARISKNYRPQVAATTAALPQLRACVRAAWTLARQHERGRYRQVLRFFPLVFALATTTAPVPSETAVF